MNKVCYSVGKLIKFVWVINFLNHTVVLYIGIAWRLGVAHLKTSTNNQRKLDNIG